jgi:type IV pilus assembly protein PilO
MSNHTFAMWKERLVSPLFWDIAGVAVLLVLVIVLGIRFGLDLVATNGSSSSELAGKQVELKALELETAPLRGLDTHVSAARTQLDGFYSKRIPSSYSAISARIGELQVKSGVRLSRLQYTQGKAGNDLTEISMDAGIIGAYPAIMRFVNKIERDQTFFVIRAMSLTGQQGGLVNLRIRISTWLRPADASASPPPEISSDEKSEKSSAAQTRARKEGK